jgi:hypothetical protein
MNAEDAAAAEALSGLRHSSTSSSSLSSFDHTAVSYADIDSYMTSMTELDDKPESLSEEHFLERVSHLPLVGSAFRAYELGKNSSRVVKVSPALQRSLQGQTDVRWAPTPWNTPSKPL